MEMMEKSLLAYNVEQSLISSKSLLSECVQVSPSKLLLF